MDECFFHPGRPAVIRCKQCGKPLCSQCRYITEYGIFCGEDCAKKFEIFYKRVEELEKRRKPEKKGIKVIRGFVKFVIYLLILYFIFRFLKGFLK